MGLAGVTDGGQNEKWKDFDARLERARSKAGLEPAERPQVERPRGASGVQVGIELVAGVAGGGLIGYGLDSWLGTWPGFFIGFFFLGAAAGMLNAYRHIRRASEWPDERR
jgi:ATP synthase protein I